MELIYQTAGEFNEKFEAKDLTTITKLPKESVVIMADGRRIWRVVENLYNNVAKYAMAHTRVYVTMETSEQKVIFSIKNISEQPLHGSAAELTERLQEETNPEPRKEADWDFPLPRILPRLWAEPLK